MWHFRLIACVLPLAACSSEPDVDMRNAGVQEVAEEVSQAGGGGSFVEPGKWESRVQFLSMEGPGIPEAAKSVMRNMNERREVYTTCLKPEDVKKPKEDFFAGGDNKNCRYDRFTMGGGKIDAVMRCSGEGGSQVMQLDGTYSPESYSMQMAMTAEASAGQAQAMTMKMRVDAKRVGECDDNKG